MYLDEPSLLSEESQLIQHFLDRYQAKKEHDILHGKTPILSLTKPKFRF